MNPCPSSGYQTSGNGYIAAAANSANVVTSAVGANSIILLTPSSALGTALGVTCNTTLNPLGVGTITAGSLFSVIPSSAPSTNPECFSWQISH